MFYIYYFFIYLLPLLDVSGEESLTHCGYMGRWESGFLRETESCWMPVCVSEHTDTHNEKGGWVGEKQPWGVVFCGDSVKRCNLNLTARFKGVFSSAFSSLQGEQVHFVKAFN